MSKNDDTIIALKEQLKKKNEELGKKIRFAPITSCSIELDGVRYNLHTMNVDSLNFLLVKLRSLEMAADDLGVSVQVSGFNIKDWIVDILAKINVINRGEKEKELKVLENKLNTMLSADKQTELELEKIAALLS